MACLTEYLECGGAAVGVIGGGMAVDVAIDAAAAAAAGASGGTAAPAAAAAAVTSNIVIMVGAITVYIGTMVALVNCYNAAGDHEDAQAVQHRIDAMQQEINSLNDALSHLRQATGI
jgi:hypothetical protein